MLENSTYESGLHNIYTYMACMYPNEESPILYFGYSYQLTNCILDSGTTCHMTPDISDFIPGPLVETDKYIEVADGGFFIAKQTG